MTQCKDCAKECDELDDGICVSCIDNYICCYSCAVLVHNNYSFYSEYRDEYYCESCYNICHSYCDECDRDHHENEECESMRYFNSKQTSYYTNNKKFLNTKGLSIGIELELDDTEDSNGVSSFVNNYFSATSDGSLDYGTEFVSVPSNNDATYEIITKGIQNIINSVEYTIKETCGLHIHYGVHNGEFSDDELMKIRIVYALYYDVLKEYVDRSRLSNHFCANFYPVSTYLFSKNISFDVRSRYGFVNFDSLRKYGTIEIRFKEATDDVQEILNWVVLNMNIIDYARKTSFNSLLLKKGGSKEFNKFLKGTTYTDKGVPSHKNTLGIRMRIASSKWSYKMVVVKKIGDKIITKKQYNIYIPSEVRRNLMWTKIDEKSFVPEINRYLKVYDKNNLYVSVSTDKISSVNNETKEVILKH